MTWVDLGPCMGEHLVLKKLTRGKNRKANPKIVLRMLLKQILKLLLLIIKTGNRCPKINLRGEEVNNGCKEFDEERVNP